MKSKYLGTTVLLKPFFSPSDPYEILLVGVLSAAAWRGVGRDRDRALGTVRESCEVGCAGGVEGR